MFTGLVETLGRVERVIDENSGRRFFLSWPGLTEPLVIGESVAVNGCCLTVVAASNERFELQAGPETLIRTNLGDKQAGHRVNLERSLRVGDRLGGYSRLTQTQDSHYLYIGSRVLWPAYPSATSLLPRSHCGAASLSDRGPPRTPRDYR